MRCLVPLLLALLPTVLHAQTFTSTSGGSIPDGTAAQAESYGAPLDVPIPVSGVAQGTIDTVSIAFRASHTWVGDLEVTLVSPYGQEHLLFARTGATLATDAGSAANLVAANTYTFNDPAANVWWATAVQPDNVDVPSATARTVPSGGAGVTNPPTATSLLGVFRQRPPNGTWILRFRDGAAGDVGNVTSASITLTTTGVTRTVTKIEDTDDGACDTDCSLREAMAASSNGASSVDRIEFARPYFDSPRRIVLNSSLEFSGLSGLAFAVVGPGAPLLNLSGAGRYRFENGDIVSKRDTFSGIRVTDFGEFSNRSPRPTLMHGMEFAFNDRVLLDSAEINDSSFHSNRSGSSALVGITLDLRRVTISGNTTGGGAVSAFTIALSDCTIVGNRVIGTNAAGVIQTSTVARLRNTVVAGNSAIGSSSSGQDLGSGSVSSFVSQGHNLIGDGSGFAAAFNQAGDQFGTPAAPLNPVLSPLGRHGGLIPVHVPLPGSPLLDKGRRVGRDARGVALVDLAVPNATGGNGGDIGAVELSAMQVSTLADSGAGSLRQVLLNAPAPPAITDIILPVNLPPAATITLTSGELTIAKHVAIHGPGARKLTISANRQSRVFAALAGSRASISGLSLVDGNGVGTNPSRGGGILVGLPGSQLSVVDSVLRNGSSASGIGGWSMYGFGEFIGSTATDMRTNVLIATQTNSAMAVLHRATLSGCSGLCFGAGAGSEVSVVDSTFAAAAGAEVASSDGRLFTRNALFAGSVIVLLEPGLISGGHNLVAATASTRFNNQGDQVGTLAAPLDARLSPLAFHGGPVPTHVPLAGSPALDQGLRFGADARGRPSFDVVSIGAATGGDNGDIGAIEAQVRFVSNTNDSGPGSLRQAVIDANTGADVDDVLFDLPAPSTINLGSRLPNPVAGGALNLLGPGASQLTLTGSNANQLFSFTAPGHLGISRLTLAAFRGVDGPALEAYQTEVHLTELQVLTNQASRDGGAMLIGDADAVIRNSTFAGNAANGNHGAVAYLGNQSRLLVASTTFSGNTGSTGSALSNVARGAGNSVLQIENTTFAGNLGSAALSSVATGSGLATSGARNTLFTGAASSIVNSGANASFVSGGFNLSSTSEPLLTQGTDRTSLDPNLGPLQNNGGATFTRALIVPSAAIDAGARSTVFDQRGSARTVDLFSIADAPGSDGTDIGAFELQSAPDNPPLLDFSPGDGSTINYSAAGTASPIVVAPSAGTGAGAGATTTLGACSIAQGGAAFPSTSIAQLSFVGGTTVVQNLVLPGCAPQSAAVDARLDCPYTVGTVPPLDVGWTLRCPAAAADLMFLDGFE